MTTLEDLSRNIEAMSMSSIVTDIATPPPPPPPLELERWRTLNKSYDRNQKRSNGGFFARQFSLQRTDNVEKSRGGEACDFSRFSRESSVASDKSESSLGSNFSIGSKSSTLSRLFSRKSKQKSSSTYARSASIDSIVTGTWRRRKPAKTETWSTPATPIMSSNPYGTWKRRGSSDTKTSHFSQKIRDAFLQEKQRVGKFVLKSRNLS